MDLVEGKVWTFGWVKVDLTDLPSGRCAFSSYIAMNSSTTPKLIDPSFFGGARVATVSTGLQHSAFVTVDGSLYMYGSMNPEHTYKEDWHAEGKGDMNNDDIPTAVAGRYIAAWYTGSATSDIFRAHGQSAAPGRRAAWAPQNQATATIRSRVAGHVLLRPP